MTLDIDPANPLPIYQQIVEQLVRQIAIGALRPGDRIPTVRELAVRARVNRNTTARAIQVLESRGLVHTRIGQGTFVSEKARSLVRASAGGWLDRALARLLAEAEAHGFTPGEVSKELSDRVKGAQPGEEPGTGDERRRSRKGRES